MRRLRERRHLTAQRPRVERYCHDHAKGAGIDGLRLAAGQYCAQQPARLGAPGRIGPMAEYAIGRPNRRAGAGGAPPFLPYVCSMRSRDRPAQLSARGLASSSRRAKRSCSRPTTIPHGVKPRRAPCTPQRRTGPPRTLMPTRVAAAANALEISEITGAACAKSNIPPTAPPLAIAPTNNASLRGAGAKLT